MYISQNIKYLRKQRKLSQNELAVELGVNMATISTYERGRSEPNLATLTQIAEFFSVSIDELILKDLSAIEETNQIASLAKDLEEGKKTVDEVYDEVGEANMAKINRLLELRVNELERAIKQDNPELAKALKIE